MRRLRRNLRILIAVRLLGLAARAMPPSYAAEFKRRALPLAERLAAETRK